MGIARQQCVTAGRARRRDRPIVAADRVVSTLRRKRKHTRWINTAHRAQYRNRVFVWSPRSGNVHDVESRLCLTVRFNRFDDR